jgi:hypothetical protein
MAKWAEIDPAALTFARDADGGLRFYAGHVCVGVIPNDRMAALIQDAAALLQRRGVAT